MRVMGGKLVPPLLDLADDFEITFVDDDGPPITAAVAQPNAQGVWIDGQGLRVKLQRGGHLDPVSWPAVVGHALGDFLRANRNSLVLLRRAPARRIPLFNGPQVVISGNQ